MKLLVDDLERVSTESVAHRELFAKLRREMDAARDALKLHNYMFLPGQPRLRPATAECAEGPPLECRHASSPFRPTAQSAAAKREGGR
jgi:hypothetical protein